MVDCCRSHSLLSTNKVIGGPCRKPALTNYVLLVLLDEKVQGVQRASLVEFVHATDAKNAGDLGIKVRLATESLATKLYGNTLLA